VTGAGWLAEGLLRAIIVPLSPFENLKRPNPVYAF
jgi:hypothetical protein